MPPSTPNPDPDPVTSKSLSRMLLTCSLILVVTLVWALLDETFFLRPWKRYQRQFAELYTSYLKKVQPVQGRSEEAIRKSPTYVDLSKQIEDARKAAAPEIEKINKELTNAIQPRLSDLTPDFQTVRGHIAALTYDLEHATSDRSKKSIQKEI